MELRAMIQDVIDYIEDNLRADISVGELADLSGYSRYHFCRIFRSFTGMSIKRFILRRKLLHSAYEISSGRNAGDVAFDYGYSSYSGFYKAFFKEFACSPQEFSGRFQTKKPHRISLYTEEYIMITKSYAKEILSREWGIKGESVTDIIYPSSGNISENGYYIGDKYVLKFTNNLGKVFNGITLGNALISAGIPAPEAVRTLSGEEYIQCGEIYYYVTKRISGKNILSKDLYNDLSLAYHIGEVLARLHTALEMVDFPVNEVNLTDKIKNILPVMKEILGLSGSFCSEYEAVLEESYASLPVQIIHRDPNPSNIILTEAGGCFVDFELSEKNVRIYDICYAATAVLSETFIKNDPDFMKKWVDVYRSIISGYDEVSPLSHEEKRMIPHIILANQFICVNYFSKADKYQDIFMTNKEMTLAIIGIWDELKMVHG